DESTSHCLTHAHDAVRRNAAQPTRHATAIPPQPEPRHDPAEMPRARPRRQRLDLQLLYGDVPMKRQACQHIETHASLRKPSLREDADRSFPLREASADLDNVYRRRTARYLDVSNVDIGISCKK